MLQSSRFLLLALLPLTIVGCDTEDDSFDPTEFRSSSPTPNPTPLFQPYHGHWEGLAEQVDGNVELDYNATITLNPAAFCNPAGPDGAQAVWDYFHAGLICTSHLDLFGVAVDVHGTRTWMFYDENLTGPCTDGWVTLTETNNPGVMWHQWRDLDGILDAEGFVTRDGMCGD